MAGGSQRVLEDYRKIVDACWSGEKGNVKSINVNVGPFPTDCNKPGEPIPDGFDYDAVPGLPRESRQRLKEIRPASFGQAARVPGVRASDIAILHVWLEKRRRENGDRGPQGDVPE